MLSNPTVESLKVECDAGDAGDAASVSSSHGSATGTLASTVVDKRSAVGGGTGSNKPSWVSEDEPAALYFGEPPYVKKERVRNDVENWLWELRTPALPPGGDYPPDEEPSDDVFNKSPDAETTQTFVFDLSRKDSVEYKPVTGDRPSTPFPNIWESAAAAKEAEKEKEITPSFKNFLDDYKSAEGIGVKIPNAPRKKCDFVSASCPPLDHLFPNLENIKCDISARSSRTFWLETLANYHKIHGDKALEDFERKKFENDLLGTDGNRIDVSDIEPLLSELNGHDVTLDEDKNRAYNGEHERAFDRQFLSAVDEEDGDKSSEESSGYVGSNDDETKAVQQKQPLIKRKSIQRRRSVNTLTMKEEMDMMIMATKMYRQTSRGRRRRCTSTPLASPEKPLLKTHQLLSSLLPSTNSFNLD